MTSVFNETTINRIWQGLSVFIVLLIAFLSTHPASANGNGIAFEAVVVQSEAQVVDIDGDGRFETYSADYTVFADGTAEGFVTIDDEKVDIERGSFGLTDDGNVSVQAGGVLVHEVGHWVSFRHEFGLSSAGTPVPCDGCDCIIWDIDSASGPLSFPVSVQFYFR